MLVLFAVMLKPTIVTLDLANDIIFHQRKNHFADGGDRPSHSFAYFSINKPYYETNNLNQYNYSMKKPIDKMILLDKNFYPEDLYEWVNWITNSNVHDAYSLNSIICEDLGLNGWFIENQEYILSKRIISQFDFLTSYINNSDRPMIEKPYDIYYI